MVIIIAGISKPETLEQADNKIKIYKDYHIDGSTI